DRQISSAFIGGTPHLLSFLWHRHPPPGEPGAGVGGGIPNTIWRNFIIPPTPNLPPPPFPSPGGAGDAPGRVLHPRGRGDRQPGGPATAAAPRAPRHDPRPGAGTVGAGTGTSSHAASRRSTAAGPRWRWRWWWPRPRVAAMSGLPCPAR